jgi:transposase-like protein
MTQRAAPFYCPYCGDEDLQPYGEQHGAWWCQSCRRAWTLRMLGIGSPGRGLEPPASGEATRAD